MASRCGTNSFQKHHYRNNKKRCKAFALLVCISVAFCVIARRRHGIVISLDSYFQQLQAPISLQALADAATATAEEENAIVFDHFNATTPPRAPSPYRHRHAIPDILIFTYRINLLETVFDFVKTPHKKLTKQQKELLALQRNVRNIIQLHPTSKVRFLTDKDCIKSIRAVFHGRDYATATADGEELIRYFIAEKEGMYKADLCRGAALYETGGLYMDVDLGVRMNLWQVLRTSTEFATVRTPREFHDAPGYFFFQAFAAANPHHPVLWRYVQLFLRHYRGENLGRARLFESSSPPFRWMLRLLQRVGPFSWNEKKIRITELIGVILLRRAFDEIQAEQQSAQGEETDPASARTHLDLTTELWQEEKYEPEYQETLLSHVPPPKWGPDWNCRYVVVSSLRKPLTVPLYSRILGSRMCPMEESVYSNWRWYK